MKQKTTTMNVSLPVGLRTELKKKLERKAYSNASEYVRELIRKDLQREAIEQVDALLLEGLHSGPATPMTERDWQELRTLAGRKPSRRHATKKTSPLSRRAARLG
jgi:antitoxin ParD1/3/4